MEPDWIYVSRKLRQTTVKVGGRVLQARTDHSRAYLFAALVVLYLPLTVNAPVDGFTMSGVEAAASLFGSDDPASDPFGSLGGGNIEVASENVIQQQHGTDSQQQQHQATGAADLFSGGDSSYPEFGAVGGHSGQQDYSSWPATAPEVNAYNPQDYYQAPATTNSGYADVQASQVGYGAFVFRLVGMKPTSHPRSTNSGGLLQ